MREDGLLGWSTDALVKLDDEVPGVLSRVLTAAPARRQAIFAALAAREVNDGLFRTADSLFPPHFAEVLRHGRISDILRRAFGDVPEGFTGALERVGERPLDRPEDYLAIRDVLASNDQRAATALRSGGKINRAKMRVMAALDPRWVHANTLSRIDSPVEANTFNHAIVFVQSVNTKATDEAVAEAIARMNPTLTLPRLLQRMLRRADRLPAHPVTVEDHQVRPLLTVNQHIEVARRYRNCLTSKIGEIAAGRMAVAEFRGEVLLEFRPLTANAGWLLWAIHGHRNGPVDHHVAEAAASKCETLGIPRPNENVGGVDWHSFRRFTREMDWDWAA
jgi:hypothetical protein